MSSDTNLVFDPTGRADLPQHRHGLLWHGPRLPRPRRQGAQIGAGVLEDLWRVPEHEGHGGRDCDGHARCDTVWVSRSAPCYGRRLPRRVVEASHLRWSSCLILTIAFLRWAVVFGHSASRSSLPVSTTRGVTPSTRSTRPVPSGHGRPARSARTRSTQRRFSRSGESVRALIARVPPSAWKRRLAPVRDVVGSLIIESHPDLNPTPTGITTTSRSKTRSTRRS